MRLKSHLLTTLKECAYGAAARLARPRAAMVVMALSTALVCGARLVAQESRDPLLDLMIEKGMVTADEARKVRAEADAIRTNAPSQAAGSKSKLGSVFKDLSLYGDLRLRYEDRRASSPDGSRIQLDRERAALRVGVRGEMLDDYYFGVRLDTASNPRSAWITLGTSAGGVPYQGPFGKSTAGVNLGQLYLGWRPTTWFDVTAGKMANPLYTTSMVWDGDLSPEGLAERFKYKVGKAEFFATMGQFVYQDANPAYTSPGFFNLAFTKSNPAFLLAWQGGVKVDLTSKLSAKVAPVLYNYTGGGVNYSSAGSTLVPDFTGTFVGEGSTNSLSGNERGWSGYPQGYYNGFTGNQTGVNDLRVLEIPGEINLALESVNLRLFGDYAQNLDGGKRAAAAYQASINAFQPLGGGGMAPLGSAMGQDNKAYQFGLAVGSPGSLGIATGQVSRRHAWEARTYWQHVEQYALDPNLLDSDVFEGRGNLQGIFAAVAFGLTDNITASARYGYAKRINSQLGTGGSNQDVPQINPIDTYSLLQIDLSLRF